MNTNLVAQAGIMDATDEELAEHLADAHLPTLLPALAYATGDFSLLNDDLRPLYAATPLGLVPQGGLSPMAQARLRDLALTVLRRFRDEGVPEILPPSTSQLSRLMEYMLGPVSDEYVPLLKHQLGVPEDVGAPGWNKTDLAPDRDFTTVIVGAGMSGLAAAYRLKQAGVPFVILERNADLGGVWLDNSYPGCRLDTSNSSYSYSFLQNGSWTEQYSSREAVRDYFSGSADKLGIRDHIRFNTALVSGEWDEGDGSWRLTVRTASGHEEELRVQALITAVGHLNVPVTPAIENIESFAGPTWHSAQWNHDVDLTGKRIGVIGTGASAFQIIPKMAETASQVTVFQRKPPWIMPTPGYNSLMKPGLHWLFQNVPAYHRWYRVYQFWSSVDSRRPFAQADGDWTHPISVSEKNEELRQALVGYLEKSFGDRPDLLKKVIPDYPPYGKRMLRDDGTWTAALKRPNVKLETSPIVRGTERGLETADGESHEVDVIIYGTGFRSSDFLYTMSLTGRGGIDLHEQWKGDPRAYYGVTIPNFPNLFCISGPNTGLNANGSVVLMSEAAVDYTLDGIRVLLERGLDSMDLHGDVFEEYNDRIDAASRQMAYGAARVNSANKSASGRVAVYWPLNTIEYWNGTRAVVETDYDFA